MRFDWKFWVGVCIFSAAVVALCWRVKTVKASSDCPVQSATPDADGSTTVVFNCDAYIITIQEPQWSN